MNVTMSLAKGMFFDPNKILNPARRAKAKCLQEFGRYVRATAKRMIRVTPKNDVSKPGQVPHGHDGKVKYKDFIWYFHDKANDEVVIGAVLLPRKDSTRMPGVLEYGGTAVHNTKEFRTRSGKVVAKVTSSTQAMHAPRPHMRRAFDIAIKVMLPKLLANSIKP